MNYKEELINGIVNVRGGAGDITKPDLNARPQDNLYLAVNSEWIEKQRFLQTVQELAHLMALT